MSRDLKWGVPVPVEGAEGKVLYVWFDAPIGYISNTKEILPDTWQTWWKDPETRIINFIGKDNIVFHCIVFPAMLMAYGDNFQLPDNVPANEFLNLEGDKISTSRNWAVWLHEYLRDFPGKQDVLRYVLTVNAPEAKDNDFTWRDFQAHNNNELVAILGNFVNRAIVLTHKYFEGKVPAAGALTDDDRAMIAETEAAAKALTEAIETFHFRDAAKYAMEIARIGNRYLQTSDGKDRPRPHCHRAQPGSATLRQSGRGLRACAAFHVGKIVEDARHWQARLGYARSFRHPG